MSLQQESAISHLHHDSDVLAPYDSGKESAGSEFDKQTQLEEGELKFHRLSWQRLAICLLVEAIALGSLSLPSVFATVGMVAGVLLTVGIGFIAIYTSYVVGQVKLKYPHVMDYADAVRLIWGRFGYELTSVMFVLFLVLLVGSHTLTGTIAFVRIIEQPGVCALIWGVISAILLFVVALPPTFHDFAVLGYIDFVSIVVAIIITIIATGVEASKQMGGLGAVEWSVWPPEGVTFYEAFLSTTNIVFAYSFSVAQFTFMSELAVPKDYIKSIWALGLTEIFIYTVTGAVVYRFVGNSVASPALLSAGPVVSRVAFGIALPVIFISGSINSTVVGRYIMNRAFPNSPIRFINSKAGWLIWIAVIGVITVISWVVAQAIPFFNDLLGIISSLFISGFTFYFPALFWFQLIKEGKWYKGWHNIGLSVANAIILAIGLAVLGCGTYASVNDIVRQYAAGSVRGSFSCNAAQYS